MKTVTVVNKWSGKRVCQFEPNLASLRTRKMAAYIKELEKATDHYATVIKQQAFEIASLTGRKA